METSPAAIIGLQWALALVISFSATALGAQSQMAQVQLALPAPTPFPVCIDDSDCEKLGEGNKYACFQYICYPWKNDSHIAPKDRRKTCRKDEDCEPGQECYRHHDLRLINRGLCFDEVKSCQAHEDCSKDYKCCGANCCEQKYYNQFSSLPCISDLGCRDLGLGQFCCPRKGENSQCCDEDPNPTTTPYPRPHTGSATIKSISSGLVLVALIMAV